MFYLGRGQIMFSMSWKFTIAAALMATLATPALAQRLDRRADLISPQSGRADPGDMVLDIKVTEALPNAFGAPDIFGRRRPAGRTVVQYLGMQNGTAYFAKQSVAISSNETTMTRTPIIIPQASQTVISGQIGTESFNATARTFSGTTIVAPRPHSESHVGLAPVKIAVKVGGQLRVEGRALHILRANSDGSIDYTVR
jgi:hypothetical protein